MSSTVSATDICFKALKDAYQSLFLFSMIFTFIIIFSDNSYIGMWLLVLLAAGYFPFMRNSRSIIEGKSLDQIQLYHFRFVFVSLVMDYVLTILLLAYNFIHLDSRLWNLIFLGSFSILLAIETWNATPKRINQKYVTVS